MTDGRRKGQDAMNKVCREFSHWLFPDTPPDIKVFDLPFRVRSTSIMPVEGHWDGQGDILHRPDIYFPFCTEVKKHEGWTLDALLRENSPIWKWWEQCVSQANKDYSIKEGLIRQTLERPINWRGRSIPLLVFMRNRIPPYVMLPKHIASHLNLLGGNPTTLTVRGKNHEALVVCLLKTLTQTSPQKLKGLEA